MMKLCNCKVTHTKTPGTEEDKESLSNLIGQKTHGNHMNRQISSWCNRLWGLKKHRGIGGGPLSAGTQLELTLLLHHVIKLLIFMRPGAPDSALGNRVFGQHFFNNYEQEICGDWPSEITVPCWNLPHQETCSSHLERQPEKDRVHSTASLQVFQRETLTQLFHDCLFWQEHQTFKSSYTEWT